MKQSKTKYIHSLLPFLICPSILIPLPTYNHHPHRRQHERIIASRVTHPPHNCRHANRQSQHNDGKVQSGVHPAATAARMDNNKTQSVIHPVITTLPADDDETQSIVCPVHHLHHGTDDCDTTMAKRIQASTLPPPPRKRIMPKHNQSSTPSPLPCQQTIRFYCASAKLPPPPPN